MAAADQRPGRRRAVPEPKPRRLGRGRPDAERPEPADSQPPAADRPVERSAERPAGGRRAARPVRETRPQRDRVRASAPASVSPAPVPAAAPAPPPAEPPRPAPPLEPASELTSDPDPSPADLVPPALPAPALREDRGRLPRWSTGAVAVLWTLVFLAGLAGVVSAWTPLTVPALVPKAGAVTVSTALAFALGVRAGGRPLISAAIALALTGAAVGTGMPVLLAGAAVSTTVVGSVLGVIATTPASTFPRVVRECLVATAVVVAAGFAANAYGAQLSVERAGYLCLGLSLAGALALVYRLGAGLSGLGTRGAIMVVGGIGLLAVTLAYTEALSRWGPPGLVTSIEDATAQVRTAIGAVPRPTEFLVGFPVLAWGIFSRARRRQGWWGAGFGAAGLAAVATSLLHPELSLVEFGLGLGYNLVLGLLFGLLVIRTDTFLSGTRGRRARQAEEASAHRPEPGRLHPLL